MLPNQDRLSSTTDTQLARSLAYLHFQLAHCLSLQADSPYRFNVYSILLYGPLTQQTFAQLLRRKLLHFLHHKPILLQYPLGELHPARLQRVYNLANAELTHYAHQHASFAEGDAHFFSQ